MRTLIRILSHSNSRFCPSFLLFLRHKTWWEMKGNFMSTPFHPLLLPLSSFFLVVCFFVHKVILWNIKLRQCWSVLCHNFFVSFCVLHVNDAFFLVSIKADLICLNSTLHTSCVRCSCGCSFSHFRHKLRYGLWINDFFLLSLSRVAAAVVVPLRCTKIYFIFRPLMSAFVMLLWDDEVSVREKENFFAIKLLFLAILQWNCCSL